MMNNNLENDIELTAEETGAVTGGASEQKMYCPIHVNHITPQYDSIRYQGGLVTRYRCDMCNRLYSLLQVLKEEDLSFDYTTLG